MKIKFMKWFSKPKKPKTYFNDEHKQLIQEGKKIFLFDMSSMFTIIIALIFIAKTLTPHWIKAVLIIYIIVIMNIREKNNLENLELFEKLKEFQLKNREKIQKQNE